MIRNSKTNNPNKNFYQIVKGIAESVVNKHSDTVRKNADSEKENKEVPEIKKGGNGVKWTDVMMVIISAFLAYYTWQLFNTATDQSKSAQESADAAIKAVKQDSLNVSNADRIAKIKDSVSRIKDSLTIKLANKSLEAQINSLKQAQKDFEIENRPFIVFTNIVVDTTFKNNIINATYRAYNVGKFPAKVSYMVSKINYGVDTSLANRFEIGKWIIRPSKEFLPNNAFLDGTVTLPSTKEEIKYFKNGIIHIFIYFHIRYYSSVLITSYSNYTVWQVTMNNGGIDVSAIENK